MTRKQRVDPALRVILFGMECAFTLPVLEMLTETPDLNLQAIVLPENTSNSRSIPISRVASIINRNNLPVLHIRDRNQLHDPAFLTSLSRLKPDIIVVACFPWRLPATLLAIPSIVSLNIHPSLLPDGRGPEPVFWAFRWELQETGTTLHLLDQGLDTGPILRQERLAISPDDTMLTLEHALASLGARMLRELLANLHTRTLHSAPQANGPLRTARFPLPGDLTVTTVWAASDAARFIRATVPVYGPIHVFVLETGQELAIEKVISISESEEEPKVRRVTINGNLATIPFADHSLVCQIRLDQQPLVLRQRPNVR